MHVINEYETIDLALRGASLARFGDGELRLAVGGSCSSQRAHANLQRELSEILSHPRAALTCIPNFARTPRKDVWDKYAKKPYAKLYQAVRYGSSFITRPDNAPWIDTPEYWSRVRQLWEGKVVTIVAGKGDDQTWLKDLDVVKAIRPIWGPEKHAYDEIDRIEEEIGKPSHSVLLSLGATATVLAARLAEKGVHALDLGHIWHFMAHAGAFAFSPKDLRSRYYAEQLKTKHNAGKWGRDGHAHANEILDWASLLGARSALDYGCGAGTLAVALAKCPLRIYEYDPGIRGKDHLPKPAQLIVCTDVLEHVEVERLDNVLKHQFALASLGAYFVIDLAPAREHLPDGRNAHLNVQSAQWWLDKLVHVGWKIDRHDIRKGLYVWARK